MPVPRILENETTSPRDVANSLGITRLVLAVLVLYSHSFAIKGTASDPVADMLGGQEFPGGIAVKFFFALSGFLLFASLQRNNNLAHFLRNRILRIYPAFLVAFFLCVILVGTYGSNNAPEYLRSLLDPKLLSAAMQLDKIPYNPSTYEQLNGSIWTIKIEFEAYIALVCLALVGALSRRYLIALIWVASFGLFIASNEGVLPNRFAHYAAHIEFWNYFATGIAFAAFHSRIPRTGWIALTALVTCAAAIASNTLDYALVIAGVYLLFYLGLASGRFSGFGRRTDLSYGTYLFAWPIQVVVSDILPVEASPYVVTLLVLPVVLCVAFASWTLVERPALRLKQPYSRRTEGGPLTVSAAMAIPERH